MMCDNELPLMDYSGVDSVRRFLEKAKTNNADFSNFYDKLASQGDVILVGGAIRDIVLSERAPRDLDIISLAEPGLLKEIVSSYHHTSNQFGGHKLDIGGIKVDVWSLSDNWAFKNHLLEASEKNISKGAFFDFDAVFINLSTGYWDAEFFNYAVCNKRLGIVDSHLASLNPTTELNVLRSLFLSLEWNLSLSNELLEYIEAWFNKENNPYPALEAASIRHYGSYAPLERIVDSYWNDSLMRWTHKKAV